MMLLLLWGCGMMMVLLLLSLWESGTMMMLLLLLLWECGAMMMLLLLPLYEWGCASGVLVMMVARVVDRGLAGAECMAHAMLKPSCVAAQSSLPRLLPQSSQKFGRSLSLWTAGWGRGVG